jgi:ankyrin repeat protein
MPLQSPTLYRLATERKYNRIPEFIRSNPADNLGWKDRYGSTALHILCQARVVDPALIRAVDAILERAPHQLAWKNFSNRPPLYYAVGRKQCLGKWYNSCNEPQDDFATELVLRLLQACPQSVLVRTQKGLSLENPLSIACENSGVDVRVLQAMLELDPSLLLSKEGHFDMAENLLRTIWECHMPQDKRRKMAVLLQAAFASKFPNASSSLLNAACSVPCPTEYFVDLIKGHDTQYFLKQDENGRSALHYAMLSARIDTARCQSHAQTVVETILNRCPQAAQLRDNDGRLPLHVAVGDTLLTWQNGVVRELTFCYPESLRQVDSRTGLVPFLASATHANASRFHLSTTFILLLAAPDMLTTARTTVRRDCNLNLLKFTSDEFDFTQTEERMYPFLQDGQVDLR